MCYYCREHINMNMAGKSYKHIRLFFSTVDLYKMFVCKFKFYHRVELMSYMPYYSLYFQCICIGFSLQCREVFLYITWPGMWLVGIAWHFTISPMIEAFNTYLWILLHKKRVFINKILIYFVWILDFFVLLNHSHWFFFMGLGIFIAQK